VKIILALVITCCKFYSQAGLDISFLIGNRIQEPFINRKPNVAQPKGAGGVLWQLEATMVSVISTGVC
jgi:hypothetical protein